jgi:hypothetical protein
MRAITQAADQLRGLAKVGVNDIGRDALIALITRGFDWAYAKAIDGMPGLDSAEDLAATYVARHATTDAAVRALVTRHAGIAAAAGFVTGSGGFVSLPVALPANLASALISRLVWSRRSPICADMTSAAAGCVGLCWLA